MGVRGSPEPIQLLPLTQLKTRGGVSHLSPIFKNDSRTTGGHHLLPSQRCSACAKLCLATGQQGVHWYPVGRRDRRLFERENPGIGHHRHARSGCVECRRRGAGRFGIAFANSISTVDSLSGKGPFRKGDDQCLQPRYSLFRSIFSGRRAEDSGIKNLADMKGKRPDHTAAWQHR